MWLETKPNRIVLKQIIDSNTELSLCMLFIDLKQATIQLEGEKRCCSNERNESDSKTTID